MKSSNDEMVSFLKDTAHDMLELTVHKQGALPITLRKYAGMREDIPESEVDLALRGGGVISAIVSWDVNVDGKHTHFSQCDGGFRIISGQHNFKEWLEEQK